MSQDALKSIYFYFHSLITYGIIFWVTLHTVPTSFDFRRRQNHYRVKTKGFL